MVNLVFFSGGETAETDLVVLNRLRAQVTQGVVVHRRVHRLDSAALPAVVLRVRGAGVAAGIFFFITLKPRVE